MENSLTKKIVSPSKIARIANFVPVTLYSRVTVIVEIVVLNCQNFNQCLKGLCNCIFYGQVMFLHHSDQKSHRSQISRGAL